MANMATSDFKVASNPALHRFLVICPPLNNDLGKTLPGSELYAYHDMKCEPLRVINFYAWVLHAFCYVCPLYEPDTYDAMNFMIEVLRQSKLDLPKNTCEVRRGGRLHAS